MQLTESNRQSVLLLIIILSLVCLCSSFLLFVCAVNIKATIDERISLLETYNSETIPGLFLFVGIVNMLENGSCAYVCFSLRTPENREKMMRALIPVLVAGIVLVILEVSSTIASFVHIGLLDREFGEGIIKAMKEYVKGEELKQEIDFVQSTLGCCGEMAYTDWFRYPWIDASNLVSTHTKYLQNDGLYYSDDAPYSCCDKRSPRPCIHHHIHDNERHHKYDYKTETTIHSNGCRKVLASMYSGILTDISIISLVAALLKIVILLLLRLIHTNLTLAQESNDWEATTPAYIYFLKVAGEGEQEDKKVKDESETEAEEDKDETTAEEETETDDDDEGKNPDSGNTTDDDGDDDDDDDDDDGDDDDGGGGSDNDSPGGNNNQTSENNENVNYSRPHNFMANLRLRSENKSRPALHQGNIPAGNSYGNKEQRFSKRERNDVDGKVEYLFESGGGRGRMLHKDTSKVSNFMSKMKATLFHPNRRQSKTKFRDYYNKYKYTKMGATPNETDSDYSHLQDDQEDNKTFWPEPDYSRSKARPRNAFDSINIDGTSGSIPHIDRLNTRFNFYSERNNTIHKGNAPWLGPPQTVKSEINKEFRFNWQPISAGIDKTGRNMTHTISREGDNIQYIDDIGSYFINGVNASRNHPMNTESVSKANVSELVPLQNMKTKSTENSIDKWMPLSVEEAGVDKAVAQFPGHRGDKLVDISGSSNNPISKQKSIHITNGASDYSHMRNNFAGNTIKLDDNDRDIISRVSEEVKSKRAKQLFNKKSNSEINNGETPTRLTPPVICETTLSKNAIQMINRPQPVLATNQSINSMFIENDRLEFSNRTSNTINALNQHSLDRCNKPLPKDNCSSEYDLIPTIQRRGYDLSMENSAIAIRPIFSADEVSPEVACINFPNAVNMDCSIEIDLPSNYSTVHNAPPIPVRESESLRQMNKNDLRNISITPTSGKTTCSSDELDETVTEHHHAFNSFPNNLPAKKTSISQENYRSQFFQSPFSGLNNGEDLINIEPVNHERKNHHRSSRRRNIFLASPISSNSLDISVSSTDSNLCPKTSTPLEKNSNRLTRTRHASRTNNIKSYSQQFGNQKQLTNLSCPNLQHTRTRQEAEANNGQKNVVDDLVDISDTIFHSHTQDVSQRRSLAVISPFN